MQIGTVSGYPYCLESFWVQPFTIWFVSFKTQSVLILFVDRPQLSWQCPYLFKFDPWMWFLQSIVEPTKHQHRKCIHKRNATWCSKRYVTECNTKSCWWKWLPCVKISNSKRLLKGLNLFPFSYQFHWCLYCLSHFTSGIWSVWFMISSGMDWHLQVQPTGIPIRTQSCV